MSTIDEYLESQKNMSMHVQVKNDKKVEHRKYTNDNQEHHSNVNSEPQDTSHAESSTHTVNDVNSASESEYIASEESEYVPSEESETEIDYSIPSTSKGRPTKKEVSNPLQKYHDDGNVDRFNERIKQWKLNKKRKSSKDSDEIQGNIPAMDSDDDCHELPGGLLIPNCIWKKLYRYQKTGVKWLWELHQVESGGLLGDEMGLGKTVQIIAFLAGLSLSRGGVWGGLGPSLVVAPATVLHQWVQHCHQWWPPLRVAVLHSSGSHRGAPERLIRDIHQAHGILITTYSGMVKHSDSIESRRWHYIVLDEGHKIRNSDTQVSKAVRKVRTPYRLVVTGSPMQNNLQELWSLFDFMSPGLLGSLQAFIDHFATPITQGGYANASRIQETTALSLAVALKNAIAPYMLRRTKAEVKEHLRLPDKKEQVLFCSLSDEQKDLYKNYLLSTDVRNILDKERRYGDPIRARILVALCVLRKICNHPDLFICEVDDDITDDSELPKELCQTFGFWKRAGKMVVINSLLKIWKKQGHRALIFTQSRAMVCILEMFLQQNDYKYLKMDGSTGIGSRQPLITLFNSDSTYLVFLATTRVGGLGVNLTGADRVIIYDPDWNPAIDSQAKERAWRIGQNRDVTIYRLLSAGTVEEKIYQRQVFKQLLGNKVFLDPKQKNYLKTSTLQGLFSLEDPDKEGSTETTNIFKHTQIKSTRTNEARNDRTILNGGVSFSQSKMDAMRRLAQQISKNMFGKTTETKEEQEDPRERYKKKCLPPPPVAEEPPVNLLNDQETKANFSSVLSELDIVSMYTKPEPLDFLKWDEEENIAESKSGDETKESTEVPQISIPENKMDDENVQIVTGKESDQLKDKKINKKNCKKDKKRKRKREHKNRLNENDLSEDEDFKKLVTKVKNKKKKSEPEVIEDPDQYVLDKLFAKSGVQSALQHDKVVGIAEREEASRMHTQAQVHAMRALRALRKSRVKNWRW